MKLVSLEIMVDGQQRRIIQFHNGLNLVMNMRGAGRTGNGVGKSTLSRVIDFLFLGSIESIYIDEEFKNPNHEIEQFFINHNVEAELSFVGLDNHIHQLNRNFSINTNDCDFCIDGTHIDISEYEAIIQKLCFNINTRRPSLRSLMPKFIRNNSHRMLNTTKFLDNWAGPKDYSELLLYLFGFQNTELLTEKRDASNLIKRRERNLKSLNAIVKEQKPGAEIKKYAYEAKKLEEDLLKFDYSPEYSDPIARLTELQKLEDDFTEALLNIDRKIMNINKTVDLLSRRKGSYLSSEMKAIYDFAGVSIDGAIRQLADVLSFHENLITRKKQFLTVDMPDLLEEKAGLEAELNSVRRNKLKVFADMRSTDSIRNVTENLKILGTLKVQLGKLEGLVEQQNKSKEDFDVAQEDLSRILQEIINEIESVYLFSAAFNKAFKKMTKDIHDEEYELDFIFNDQSGACSVEVKNMASNPEGGKKKAEVLAFDLAYIQALADIDIKRPQFVFHDSIEDIDLKQIDVIFTKAKALSGQQIVSMLSDKLSAEMYEKYLPDAVLLLDEEHMFFGV